MWGGGGGGGGRGDCLREWSNNGALRSGDEEDE